MDSERTYPIKVVARRTGLTAHAIRAWEKRYSAVEPIRTPTNRRVYTEEHLQRLLLLARATRAGYSIGQVAKLPTGKLVEIVKEADAGAGGATEPAAGTAPEVSAAERHSPGAHLEACIEAMEQMDGSALDSALNGAAIALTLPVLLEEMILPLMRIVGERWHSGTLRVSQEHLASASVIAFLSSQIRSFSPPAAAPLLLVTTPVGQQHVIGAQAAALFALTDGWRVTYLGPDLPAGEIAAAVRTSDALVVALSIVYPADDPRVAEQIRGLGSLLPPGVKVLAGGLSATGYAEALESISASKVDSLPELRNRLAEIRSATVV